MIYLISGGTIQAPPTFRDIWLKILHWHETSKGYSLSSRLIFDLPEIPKFLSPTNIFSPNHKS